MKFGDLAKKDRTTGTPFLLCAIKGQLTGKPRPARTYRRGSEGSIFGTAVFNGKVVPGEGTGRELPFDLDTAICVCRQASFFEQAMYLAKEWRRHDDYLRVIMEDIGASSSRRWTSKG
ncbi:hypothetical protein JVT61DRAFT_3720 [Boletus reticuloceps]|uniref:Uncharacterized protein n=1 Tax=Boletus reticuloceps TaxID=495285 RepID=A0A8I2YQ71_9AGAM|nr:hypothetical protein JVT61DRAFT_3720 [Boletus reticuloceps]